MINVSLKDNTVIEVKEGATPAQIALSLSEGLFKAALAARVDGLIVDLSTPIKKDCSVEILTFKDDEGKEVYRHTCAHILAQAVKNIYPDAKLAIGPAIKNGFYYDFDFPSPITPDVFHLIEEEMQAIIKADLPIERKNVSKRTALTQMRGYEEPYKIQLIEDLPDGEQITFYKQGEFVDLCKGPHLASTGKVKFFKLTQLAGAYWRGSEKNKMLTRIYGTCFEKKNELAEYLLMLEEAKRRDHNKLGRELSYFMTEEKIGQGLPLLMPKGAKLFQILQRFVEDEEERRGYILTKTPSMAKSDLYKISGHWSHYRDKMFVIGDGDESEGEVLALRPMTCPFQYMIYKNGLKSYRDLPIRYAETAPLFRNEASGEMHGLIRVRQFHLSDGHIICTPEQLSDEFKACFELSLYFLTCLGMLNDITFRFSRYDPLDKEKYIDRPEDWENAESKMKQILDELKIKYVEAKGEAAFYGPKLDIQFKNVYGKEDTLITIQVDIFLSENFELQYVDANGNKKFPFIIHRSSIGCYERVMAALIEKYAGALPLWLSVVQVKILPITDRAFEYAKTIKSLLNSRQIRSEIDFRNEKIGYKIREAQMEKVPYMLILGDKELESDSVAVRSRKEGDLGTLELSAFLEKIAKEITNFN